MKLFTKIFLCSIAVVTAALAVLGYFLISGSFSAALERERDNCLDRYQLLKFTLQSAMLAEAEEGRLTNSALENAAERALSSVSGTDRAAVLDGDGRVLSSGFENAASFYLASRTNEDDVTSVLETEDGVFRYTVCGRFTESGRTVVLFCSRNISPVFEAKHIMERRFIMTYVVTEAVAALVMAVLSLFLTGPINRLAGSTRRFAEGRLSERAGIRSGGEIGELAESFNEMASTIERNIESLELAAKQKDDFTASFAHELKTPLTSVIGYADMIYQKKELSREEIREAAGFILNEGMRLEALSIKLMELIVLDRHEFTLVETEAGEALKDIAGTARPLAEKRGAELTLSADSAYIRIELDLFKTLVLNLIDNAAKAGSKHISLTGELDGWHYAICVKDDGRGIPEEQLGRITEAFYMVDKSRSRREHGAGLGLAIASRIALLHGTELEFASKPGEGTEVTLMLKTADE